MAYPRVVQATAARAKDSSYYRGALVIFATKHESRGIRMAARDLIDALLLGYFEESPNSSDDPEWVTELLAAREQY